MARHTQTMAPKPHRPSTVGLVRHHSRTSSAGSSKLALHLQFTQKDPPSHKHVEKPRKSTITHESHVRNPSKPHHLRTHSADHLSPQVLRRPSNKHNVLKADFTIASPGTDEEDWVSSESGAVTPNNPKSDHEPDEDLKTPVEPTDSPAIVSRVETARPSVSQLGAPDPPSPATVLPPAISLPELPQPPRVPSDPAVPTPPSHPIPRHSHSHHGSGKRQSSTHSLTSRSDTSLRPHPLIRGPSSGNGNSCVPKPTPLAPLTVTADSSPASTPPSLIDHLTHDGPLSSSPQSMSTTPVSPSLPFPSLLRRTSVSSAQSVATLPVPTTSAALKDYHYHHHHHPTSKLIRDRTLSTLSSSSSTLNSPALSSLAHLPTYSRPLTPQMVAYFPTPNPYVNLEAIHPLLPAPYLNTHLTVLAYRTPLRESYDRVIQAKQAR